MSPRDRAQLVRNIKASPFFNSFRHLVQELRDEERERYEESAANEYVRGRVAAMSDFLELLNGSRT